MDVKALARIGYLFVVIAISTFVVTFAGVALVEAYGPSDDQAGRVIERNEGSRTVTRCATGTSGGRCRTQTYPVYSVIGEREDGSTWIVVGQGAYDAMRGERNGIEVTSSAVTGRVVRLDGDDDSWGVRGSGFFWFAMGALIVVGGIVALWEWARRRPDRWQFGSFRRAEFAVAVPAVALGLVGLWFVTFAKTAGLDVASTADSYGDFLSDPHELLARDDLNGEIEGIGDDEFFGSREVQVAVVGSDLLGSVPAPDDDAIAVPLVREVRDRVGPADPVLVHLETPDGTLVDPEPCPSGLLRFDTPLGVNPDITGGFVCFPRTADARLHIIVGTGVFADGPFHPSTDWLAG